MGKLLKVFRDFSGGLSEVANDNMRDNELIYAKNVIPGDTFGLARAQGTEIEYPQIPGGYPVILVTTFKPVSGDAVTVAFVKTSATNSYIYKLTSGAWELVDNAAPIPLDWFIAQGKLYCCGGSFIYSYDGTATAVVTENGTSGLWNKVKTAVAVVQRGSRWFYATANNEVIFSEIGYVNKFLSTSIINVGGNNADTITALHEYNDGILIFQQRAVYMLTGWDLANGTDIELRKLNVSCGTKWPKSVCTVDNAVLYLGSNGLYQLKPAYMSTIVESKNLSAKKIAKRLETPGITDIYAAYINNTYHLSLQTASGIVEYRYHPDSRAFYGEYTQGAYCYAPDLSDDLIIGCANGYILRYDEDSTHYIDTSSGSPKPIEVVIQTKGFDVSGAMVRDAKLKKAFVVVKQYEEESSALTVQLKADYTDVAWDWQKENFTLDFDESMIYGENDYGSTYFGWMDSVTKEMTFNKKAKRLQFVMYDSTLDNKIMIYGVGILYKNKKVRGSRVGVTSADVVYDE